MAFFLSVRSIFNGFTGSCPSFWSLFGVRRVCFQRYGSISSCRESIGALLLVHYIEVVPSSESPFREVPLYTSMFYINQEVQNGMTWAYCICFYCTLKKGGLFELSFRNKNDFMISISPKRFLTS